MPKEIKRKFLVRNDSWKEGASGEYCVQGYIYTSNGVIRFRTMESKGYVTFKGTTEGISRDEFEYEVPAPDIEALIGLHCNDVIRIFSREKFMQCSDHKLIYPKGSKCPACDKKNKRRK